MEFNLDTLFHTYENLITGPYKNALSQFISGDDSQYSPPSIDLSDASLQDAIEHVQASSKYYSSISTLASFARAAQKLAEGRYKQAFRIALLESEGTNKDSREAEAAQKTATLHDELLFYESALLLFTSLEQAGRVNADSSRKIADLIHSQRITESGSKY